MWQDYRFKSIFVKECQGNLERLQYASTIEIAQKYFNSTLPKCQKFAVQKHWDFWYDNLQAQQTVLNSINFNASVFEKQQILGNFKNTISQEEEWRSP